MPVKTFADAYKASPAGLASQAALEAPTLQQPSHLDPLVRTRYGIGSWPMFKALLRRELTIMLRNRFLYIFKIAQVGGGIMSVCYPLKTSCKSSTLDATCMIFTTVCMLLCLCSSGAGGGLHHLHPVCEEPHVPQEFDRRCAHVRPPVLRNSAPPGERLL